MEVAVIDLETTGFSPASGDRIIEIGIVFLDENLEEIGTFQSLVNPGRPVSGAVHGITDEALEGQPTFAEVLAPFLESLRRTSCLVAHHIEFEKRFLTAELGSLNRRLPDSLSELCTRRAARTLGVGSNQKLGTLVRELGIRTAGPSHRALPDALATADVLRQLSRLRSVLPPLAPVDWGIEHTAAARSRGVRAPRGELTLPDPEGPRSVFEPLEPVAPGTTKPALGGVKTPMNDPSGTGVSRVVLILIEKLREEGEKGRQAAESLIQQARRHTAKLDPAVEPMSPFLVSSDLGIRGAVAAALGHVGTPGAIKAIVRAFEQCPAHELLMECSYSGCYEEPLCDCFANAIGENENKVTAKALVALLTSKTVPEAAKAGVMLKLADFDFEETKVRWPPDIVDTLESMASSDDPKISEGAIRLLGAI